jgi:ArsR family transcriptional regulator
MMTEYPLEIFKALSEETRFRIIHILMNAKEEICECDIAEILNIPQYNISRHIKLLSRTGMINKRKEGRWTYFSLSDSLDEFKSILIHSLSHIQNDLTSRDIAKLNKFFQTTNGNRCN